MTHLREGMTGTTRDGSRFEIFAERGDRFYGAVNGWAACWSELGMTVHAASACSDYVSWDILPPKPVKKYRWVMRAIFNEGGSGEYVAYRETLDAHEDANGAWLECGDPWKAIARIEGSEVTE